MLMAFIFGGVPVSVTVPETSPAVVGSTVWPAGAAGADVELVSDSDPLPDLFPQPAAAMTRAAASRKDNSCLRFMACGFLLLMLWCALSYFKFVGVVASAAL